MMCATPGCNRRIVRDEYGVWYHQFSGEVECLVKPRAHPPGDADGEERT